MGTLLHKHLCKILRDNVVSQNTKTTLDNVFWEIRKILSIYTKQQARFYKGGSSKKKTMINNNPDLDMVIYFPCTEKLSPKELQAAVKKILEDIGIEIQPQKGVSLQFNYKNIDVDIVVARAQDESFSCADAYHYKDAKKQRTSMKEALQAIKNVPHIIRLMKIWRNQHNIRWHKLAIEEFVARILKDKNTQDLDECLNIIFNDIKSNIHTIKFNDPANSNNEIHVSTNERKKVKELVTQHIEYMKEANNYVKFLA